MDNLKNTYEAYHRIKKINREQELILLPLKNDVNEAVHDKTVYIDKNDNFQRKDMIRRHECKDGKKGLQRYRKIIAALLLRNNQEKDF